MVSSKYIESLYQKAGCYQLRISKECHRSEDAEGFNFTHEFESLVSVQLHQRGGTNQPTVDKYPLCVSDYAYVSIT